MLKIILDSSGHTKKIYYNHWIGLRENLQEIMFFTIKYGVFLQLFLYLKKIRVYRLPHVHPLASAGYIPWLYPH